MRRKFGLMRSILFLLVISTFYASAGLAAECTEQFSWLPNAEDDLAGYKIYYGTTSGGSYPNVVDIGNPDPVGGRVYGDIPGLTCGTTYYAVCVAYNTQAVESSYSSQISFTPPDPDGSTVTTKIFGNADGADYTGTITDTYININEDNAVSSVTLNTYTWPDNQVANAIILKINVSQIPANARIQSATLELYQTDAGGDAAYNLNVHKIINYNPNLAQSSGYLFETGNQWTANTQCYENIPMAQADIAAAEDTVNADQSDGYKSWDVTQMVSDWVTNPATNYGVLVNGDSTATADSYRTFLSSDGADSGQRPKLTVIYTIATDGLQPPDGFSLQLN